MRYDHYSHHLISSILFAPPGALGEEQISPPWPVPGGFPCCPRARPPHLVPLFLCCPSPGFSWPSSYSFALMCPSESYLFIFIISFSQDMPNVLPSSILYAFFDRQGLLFSLSNVLLILFGQKTDNILLRHLFWNTSHFHRICHCHLPALESINQY